MPDEMTTTGGEPPRHAQLYRDGAGEWRFRIVATRGNLPDVTVADSGEGYKHKADCLGSLTKLFPGMAVEYLDGES